MIDARLLFPVEAQVWLAVVVNGIFGIGGSFFHWFQSTLTPSLSTTLADLQSHEANYSHYSASGSGAFVGPIVSRSGAVTLWSEGGSGSTCDGATSNVIGGYWFDDGAGHVLLIAVEETPYPVRQPYGTAVLDLSIVFPGAIPIDSNLP